MRLIQVWPLALVVLFQASAWVAATLILARASGKDKDVALTLNNLGLLHRDEKRMAEARAALEEALKLYRELARQNPSVYLPYVRTLGQNYWTRCHPSMRS